jgi:hypothetical protein
MTQMLPGEMMVRKNGSDQFLAVGEGMVEVTGSTWLKLMLRTLVGPTARQAPAAALTTKHDGSKSREPNGSELPTGALNHFICRRLNVRQRVIDSELFPFVSSHLVKGEHLYSVNDSKFNREFCDLLDILWVVC